VRALLAAITCEKADVPGNLARHVAVLADAAAAGCSLAVFPEFSLTGSVDAARHPDRALGLDSPAVAALVAAGESAGVGVLFGLAERSASDGLLYITQAYADGGRLVGVQRKRHLGSDEEGWAVGSSATAFVGPGGVPFGVVICAEAGVGWTWDGSVAAGGARAARADRADRASVVFMCSAPGLYGRRSDEAGWRAGFSWWQDCGLGEARRNAARLGVWVAMATQAGSTVDEDFPGIAALVGPDGRVVDRLPDWRPGILVVDIPVD
jgi:predicted amidohydrolase